MGDIAEMDIYIFEQGGRPDGTYLPRGSARGRWKRGFDYGGVRAHRFLVEKFLMNMAGHTFDQALAILTAYCDHRGFVPPFKKKPFAQRAKFIQAEFGDFRVWFHANYPHIDPTT